MSSLKLGLTACFVSNLSFQTLQDLLTNHVRPSAVVLALARHDPSSCGSSPMGRKRRAAGGDTVAHEDRTGHIPDRNMGHGLAMRMVLQAMVAGTGTTAARGVRAMVDKVKVGYAGWANWWNTKTPTPQEEWVEAARRAAETPSDIGDRADTPVRRTSTSTPMEEAREERRTREEPRHIERDWWDFPSPSGRRSRWLASSANQGVLEVMAAAASPILRSRVNPPWTERSPTGGDR